MSIIHIILTFLCCSSKALSFKLFIHSYSFICNVLKYYLNFSRPILYPLYAQDRYLLFIKIHYFQIVIQTELFYFIFEKINSPIFKFKHLHLIIR